MFIIFLLSCLAIIVPAIPVSPRTRPLQQSQKGVNHGSQPVDATIRKPEAQMDPSLPHSLDQPQPGNPQQPDQQANNQHSLQHYALFPQGGSPVMLPLPQSVAGFLPPNQLTLAQQPLIFPSYGFMPVFPSPYSNQLFSPYGFPKVSESPLPQTPINQLTNGPVLPAENAAGAAAPSMAAAQQTQQQNPPVVYMLQQPMNPSLGGLSSEELEIAAKLSQLGMFMPTMLANLPAGAAAVQAQSQFAGITNPDQRAARQTAGTSASGAQPLQGLPCSGSQLNVNNPPAGLERAVPKTPTVRSADRPKLRPTQRNLA
ncbi:ameloblastin isoform X2 [Xiphophorus hellerii]|uniref:ameloblastin isoform X2 n=1 Tax=Xiphophorus hellerii TaxID=8084 RepID=UPI0013B39688|nr:tyrosine-protein phosphatase non-receptor type 23-like isoform X2 [Xiphophorus hellerii]